MVSHRNTFYFSFLLLLCIIFYLLVSIFKIINWHTNQDSSGCYSSWGGSKMQPLLYLFHFFESTRFCSAPRAPAVYPWQDVPPQAISGSQVWKSQQPHKTVCGVSQSLCGADALCLGYRRGFLQKSLASWANMNLLNALCLEINIKFKHYLSPS